MALLYCYSKLPINYEPVIAVQKKYLHWLFICRARVKWYHNINDFANLFKSFAGIQFMTLSYGFQQSGIAVSIIS